MLSPEATDAMERAEEAQRMLHACCLCARRCGVNRLEGEQGYCGLGREAYWFREFIHYGIELELIPAHAVYLAGCNMRCVFCIAGKWNLRPTGARPWNAADMASRVRRRRREGARTLLLVGGEPTVSLPAVLSLLADLPAGCCVAWDSNMYMSPEARELLAGLVDVYVADLKFGNNWCAEALADAPAYFDVVTANLQFAAASGSLVVRHLLMPGHLGCCFQPVLSWMKASLPAPRLSLRGEYMPPAADGDLGRYVTDDELQRAAEMARGAGVELVD